MTEAVLYLAVFLGGVLVGAAGIVMIALTLTAKALDDEPMQKPWGPE